MNDSFARYINELPEKFEALTAMKPVSPDSLPRNMPKAGIYLLSENGSYLYVGNSRRLRARLTGHCHPSSKHSHASLAFILARTRLPHLPRSTRSKFMSNPDFRAVFDAQKDRIRRMEVRFIGEADPNMRALLEIYT